LNQAIRPLPFVFVHGAWHGAWAFTRVLTALAGHAHSGLACDLPAHGLKARYPAAFSQRPFDAAAFASEPSPVAATTLDDYAQCVLDTVEAACALGHERVVLVGHSMGGLAITAAAERAPERIAKLVYLSAFMPAAGSNALDYVRAPENAGEKLGALILASPRVGALRIDPRSADAAYQAAAHQAFCADVDAADFIAASQLMSCDVPAQPFASPAATTRERWGALERHYIGCTEDHVIPPALQRRFVTEADAFTPDNPTHVHALPGSHSPYLSRPDALAELLATIART
jgi:pimeloyl-ACP methyl ester carboxylesterase